MKLTIDHLKASEQIRDGAQTYVDALQGHGGKQANALMRTDTERPICAALYSAPPYDLRVPGMTVSRLSLNLTPSPVSGGISDECPRRYEASRYSLFLVPAGAEVKWRKEAPSRHLTIYFRPDLFDHSDAPRSPLTRQQALHNFNVPGIRLLADQLVEELTHSRSQDEEAADSISRLLLIHVARHLGKKRASAESLDARTLASLHEYVMDRLAEQLLVADLASRVGMPINRFSSALKCRTGRSPHQYVLALRLNEASRQLTRSSLGVAEIALACGFSSQQHMTHVMRRHTGVTPARLRALLR
jgi:AraC-like DNA-binding protein